MLSAHAIWPLLSQTLNRNNANSFFKQLEKGPNALSVTTEDNDETVEELGIGNKHHGYVAYSSVRQKC